MDLTENWYWFYNMCASSIAELNSTWFGFLLPILRRKWIDFTIFAFYICLWVMLHKYWSKVCLLHMSLSTSNIDENVNQNFHCKIVLVYCTDFEYCIDIMFFVQICLWNISSKLSIYIKFMLWLWIIWKFNHFSIINYVQVKLINEL